MSTIIQYKELEVITQTEYANVFTSSRLRLAKVTKRKKIMMELISFHCELGWGAHRTEGFISRQFRALLAEANNYPSWGSRLPFQRLIVLTILFYVRNRHARDVCTARPFLADLAFKFYIYANYNTVHYWMISEHIKILIKLVKNAKIINSCSKLRSLKTPC